MQPAKKQRKKPGPKTQPTDEERALIVAFAKAEFPNVSLEELVNRVVDLRYIALQINLKRAIGDRLVHGKPIMISESHVGSAIKIALRGPDKRRKNQKGKIVVEHPNPCDTFEYKELENKFDELQAKHREEIARLFVSMIPYYEKTCHKRVEIKDKNMK